jgi:predicted flap endonuclease-1-like 5' DNA nuclease
LVEAYAILAGTSTAERGARPEKVSGRPETTPGWAESPGRQNLQDLNGVIGGTVKHHTAIGELGIFPFATFAAIAEQAIFERAVVEQLAVKTYRLLA